MADRNDKLTASEEALLESFFEAARPDRPAEPSPELLARVLDDGYRVQDALAAPAPAPACPPAPRGSRLAAFFAAIGGAPGLAGLAAAAVAGLWIGMSPPESLSTVTTGLFGSTATDTAADEGLLGYDLAFADLLTDG